MTVPIWPAPQVDVAHHNIWSPTVDRGELRNPEEEQRTLEVVEVGSRPWLLTCQQETVRASKHNRGLITFQPLWAPKWLSTSYCQKLSSQVNACVMNGSQGSRPRLPCPFSWHGPWEVCKFIYMSFWNKKKSWWSMVSLETWKAFTMGHRWVKTVFWAA